MTRVRARPGPASAKRGLALLTGSRSTLNAGQSFAIAQSETNRNFPRALGKVSVSEKAKPCGNGVMSAVVEPGMSAFDP